MTNSTDISILTILFYAAAALMVGATALAVTRRNMVHAVIYLVLSFFGTAMLFYLLGAPFLAALEIIVYAGAIMVLFLFVIMMIRLQKPPGMFFPRRQLLPATAVAMGFMLLCGILLGTGKAAWKPLAAAQATPKAFGAYLFKAHWLAVDIASMLLLVALIGAFVLGQRVRRQSRDRKEDTQ
jgi:NADH-quinone oxidoreductase subunit J